MTPQRVALGVASVVTALVLQLGILSRLPLPGAGPDLVLVLVLSFGLAEGALSGAVTGFAAGLLTDCLSDHQLGRLALAYLVAGCLAGSVETDPETRALRSFATVGVGSLLAVLVFAGEGVLLADHRITVGALGRSGLSTAAYDLVLTPFVVPLLTGLVRRLDPADPLARPPR